MNDFLNYTNCAEGFYGASIPPDTVWTSPSKDYTYNGSTYTGELGNYWSGYSGTDGDGDGIGDDPSLYTIPDGLGNDTAPLVEPIENYGVIVYEPPAADFTYDVSSGRIPLTVNFTDTSTGDITEWSWDFGDGGSSSEQNPSHTYLAEGTYPVTLEVTGPAGTDSYTRSGAISVSGPLTSDSYNGGIPLTTARDGVVSGGLWYGSYPGMETLAEQNFTLPSYTDIEWARLYITVYCGNQINNYRGNITVDIDADGDDIFEIHENETFNTSYSLPGAGGTGPVWLSDHMNRVTSDYLMWYDLTGAITSGEVGVRAETRKIDQSFDGGVKAMTLVVAYNDGDSDEIYYWVNQGHDTIIPMDQTYHGYTGETTFGTSVFTGGWSSANLSAIYLVNTDGEYMFKDTPLVPGAPSGDYYGEDDWDVTPLFFAGQDSVLEYDSNSNYKIPLALLSVRYNSSSPGAPVANFSADPVSGEAPLAVSFTDESTGATGWSWDFGDGDSTNSTEQNPLHTYAVAGTYTVTLTATGSYGVGLETKTGYITVSGSSLPVPPVAGFSSNVTSGMVPLTVQFTDTSTNSPNNWSWAFGDGNTSTLQNPVHTFVSTGTYSVSLTAENGYGNDTEVKTNYITVNEYSEIDLTITDSVNPIPGGAVFARESNTVRVIYVENSGTGTATNITVSLYASDVSEGAVPVDTQVIDSLEGGASIVYTGLTDPTIRDLEGISVTYTVSLDPENAIKEIDETNNNMSGLDNPVKYNGYKGKGIYWEGGSNITTKHIYDLRGDMVYSTQPTEAYQSVLWTERTETWSASDLPIPPGATVVDAWLYLSYNWDQTPRGYPDWTTVFNGNTIEVTSALTPYRDMSNFGTYWNFRYGLYPINVTEYFNPGGNTFTMTKNGINKTALYPSTLVVIYSDPSATRKQIFINEECDELAPSLSRYSTTVEEATAYIPFTGMEIDTGEVESATIYCFAGSAGPDEGNVLFNGNTVALGAWQGDLCSSIPYVGDVTAYLRSDGNEAAVQGTHDGGMCAYEQILVIDYGMGDVILPQANFTASPVEGRVPLEVNFTDSSKYGPLNWSWKFGDGGTSDIQNPSHTYTVPGIYSVSLTVSNLNGSTTHLAAGLVNATLSSAPAADFTSDVKIGPPPLEVHFTDRSTNSPTIWSWQFGDGNTSDLQNPSHTYTSTGLYTVTLTASNSDGNGTKTRSGYIEVTDTSGLSNYNDIYIQTANDGTYYIDTCDEGEGLSDLHISTDPESSAGDVTTTDSVTGTFYVTCTGDRGFEDDVVLMLAVNGTIPETFGVDISASGYNWTPSVLAEKPENITYKPAAIDETFTKADFRYGPQNWKPTGGNQDYPVFAGEDMGDAGNMFRIMFIDLKSGVLGADYVNTTGNGSVKIDYEFRNLTTYAAFNVYGWNLNNSEGNQGIIDTNGLSSGYSVFATAATENGGLVTDFAADSTAGEIPMAVTFNDLTTGDPDGWLWQFGDGGTSDLQNPSHTYRMPGTYSVNLTASNTEGSNSTLKVNYITVTGILPKSGFTSDKTSGQIPLTVRFTDTSTGDPTAWSWDFGDGNTSGEQNPSHTYTAAGKYPVRLTVKNAYGTDSVLKQNYITVRKSSPGGSSSSSDTSDRVTTSRGRLDYKNTENPGEVLSSEEGKVLIDTSVPSGDGHATVNIPKGTLALGRDGEPVDEIVVERIDENSIPDNDDSAVFEFMGRAYECKPSGATFSPAIGITFYLSSFDEYMGLDGKTPVIRYYNPKTKEWEELETTFDEETMTVTAKVTHFSVYALFAKTGALSTMVTDEQNTTTTAGPQARPPTGSVTETAGGSSSISTAIFSLFAVLFIGACCLGVYRFRKNHEEELSGGGK